MLTCDLHYVLSGVKEIQSSLQSLDLKTNGMYETIVQVVTAVIVIRELK